MAIEEFTWTNFWFMRNGNLLERRSFAIIVLIGVLQLIFIANWVISWRAGGYMTTAGAIGSFFIHFFGFYAIWNRNTVALLLYMLVLCLCCLLYVANAILALLSITLNYQGGEDISPVVSFQLFGIAGSRDTQIFLFILLIVVNVLVVVLTFALLFLTIQTRKLVLEETRIEMLNLSPAISRSRSAKSISPPSSPQPNRAPPIDLNIPGLFVKHKQILDLGQKKSSGSAIEESSLKTAGMEEALEHDKEDDRDEEFMGL